MPRRSSRSSRGVRTCSTLSRITLYGPAAGTYYVLARSDADGTVPESVETNNVKIVRSVKVTAPTP